MYGTNNTRRLSVCAKDMESFRFSKYAGDCCELLKASSEFSTDRYLVQLVRVTHLAENIYHTITSSEVSPSLVLSAPLGMSLRWHQAELHKLREFPASEQPYAGMSYKIGISKTRDLIAHSLVLLKLYYLSITIRSRCCSVAAPSVAKYPTLHSATIPLPG